MRYYAVLLRTVGLFAIVAAVLVPSITHPAPQGGFVGTDTATSSKPINAPTWDSHSRPGCEPLQDGVLYDRVLVVDQQNRAHVVTFDAAWDAVHDDNAANDVWTIGGCQ